MDGTDGWHSGHCQGLAEAEDLVALAEGVAAQAEGVAGCLRMPGYKSVMSVCFALHLAI